MIYFHSYRKPGLIVDIVQGAVFVYLALEGDVWLCAARSTAPVRSVTQTFAI